MANYPTLTPEAAMTSNRTPVEHPRSVLLLGADTDGGRQIAERLLDAGHRVTVSGHRLNKLARILGDRDAEHVLAIAANPADRAQYAQLLRLAEERFGAVDLVIDAAPAGHPALPLSA